MRDDPTATIGDEPVAMTDGPDLRAGSVVSKDGIATIVMPQHSESSSEDIEASEAKASRRLKAFKSTAAWDPNLDSKDMEAIDDAVGDHDGEKENKLVDDLLENSPYPEVINLISGTVVNKTNHAAPYRFELPFETTTSTFPATLSVPGSLACS